MLTSQEVLRQQDVDATTGLDESEIALRRKRFGLTSIAAKQRVGAFIIILRQMPSPVVHLLAGADLGALHRAVGPKPNSAYLLSSNGTILYRSN